MIEKNRYKIETYINILKYIIDIPYKELSGYCIMFWKNKFITWIEVYSKFGNQMCHVI